MNRKKIVSAIAACIFVLAAGVFYMQCEQAGKAEPVQITAFSEERQSAELVVTEEIMPVQAEPLTLYVHVCGAVKNPGVYTFYEGARVIDAVNAAGGFEKEAAQEVLNQADLLWDGEQLYVYSKEEADGLALLPGQSVRAASESGKAQEENAAGSLVNINTATIEQLMQLPGIGQAKAEAIIAYRKESGGFKEIAELMQISGIKESIFEKVKDRITVRD